MPETRILTLGGKPIDYRRPPKATDIVMWSKRDTGGDICKGSFRTIAHLDHLNRRSLAKYGRELIVFQPPYNTGVPASQGTHDFDATWDIFIPGIDPWEQQRFFRANGLGGWMRKPPTFSWHYHGFTLPPREGRSISDDFRVAGFKVGKYVDGGYSLFGSLVTSSQIADYYGHAFGLSGQHTPGSDKTWFPKRIRDSIFDLNRFVASRLAEQVREDIMTTPRKVHGADVSHHQPTLDLVRAKKAGLQFLYHKATEGDGFVDTEYAARRTQAAKAKIPFGAYHFARAEWLRGKTDGAAEARHFLAISKPKPGDLIPALDLETEEGLSKAQLKVYAQAFIAEVKRQLGVTPVIYCPWDLGLPGVKWVPRYNDKNEPPVVHWDIWQFSNGILGVPDQFPGLGHVDLNTFRKGFTVDKILIPQPKPPEPKQRLRGIHANVAGERKVDQIEAQLERGWADELWITEGYNIVPWLKPLAEKHGYKVKAWSSGKFGAEARDVVLVIRKDEPVVKRRAMRMKTTWEGLKPGRRRKPRVYTVLIRGGIRGIGLHFPPFSRGKNEKSRTESLDRVLALAAKWRVGKHPLYLVGDFNLTKAELERKLPGAFKVNSVRKVSHLVTGPGARGKVTPIAQPEGAHGWFGYVISF